MKCKKCGLDNDKDRDYCQACGEYLGQEEEVKEEAIPKKTKPEVVYKTQFKVIAKAIFTTFVVTTIVLGGYSTFTVFRQKDSYQKEIQSLKKKNKQLKKEAESVQTASQESKLEGDQEIVRLKQEVTSLKEKNLDLKETKSKLEQDLKAAKKEIKSLQKK